ncbi:DNA-3-methyladenine glycosylase I [Microtetraspora sp. NBRC 13810]|uniref:DNA-3-methyladenine glycosylase I n=1 Tax=Microtetraspora sp. NBRC 13810 TaxID=3030990 RepID=UPI0024A42F8C|nr:DNA-3-methyladenine glycosylase I [Microtetraspora sp. NBRC 13810]GLW07495.1 DNA-3-methyladenine glycosylase I [Microtetraspora sp. NBRC 13810]
MTGPDIRTPAADLIRCPWATSAPDYIAYHDDEWGREVRGDDRVFERMTLEAFQSGLSWLVILRKRENFRRAFAGFSLTEVAAFTDADVERLLGDAGIVRNRAKIETAISNARVALEVPEGLSELVWRYADAGAPVPKAIGDVPAQTPGSKALAKDLKSRGFRFVGPTTAYALMQAIGLVNDHLADCWVRTARP